MSIPKSPITKTNDILNKFLLLGWWVLCCLSVWIVLNNLFLNPHRDEFEHLRSAWFVHEGLVPYRDFFQHHHPLLWYGLSPLYDLFEKTADIYAVSRLLMLGLYAGTLGWIAVIVRRFSDSIVSVLATFFFYNSYTITDYQFLAVRPDNPMLFFMLAGIYFFIRYSQKHTPRDLVISYASFFLSFCFLQKIVLFLIPFGLWQGYLIATKRIPFKVAISALIGPFLCGIGYVLYLIYQGDFRDYWELNWLLNLYWFRDFQAYVMTVTDKIYLALYLCFLGIILIKGRGLIRQSTAVLMTYTVLFLGTPHPYPCYFLPQAVFTAVVLGLGFGMYHHIVLTTLKALFVITFGISAIIPAFAKPNGYDIFNMGERRYIEDYIQPGDQLLSYNSQVSSYFKLLPLHYYWFGLARGALTDHRRFQRHPLPDLNAILREHHPRFVLKDILKDVEKTRDEENAPILFQPDEEILKQYYRKTPVHDLYERISDTK